MVLITLFLCGLALGPLLFLAACVIIIPLAVIWGLFFADPEEKK